MAAFPSSSIFLHQSSLSPINFDHPSTAFPQHNLDHEDPSVFSVTNKNSMDSSSVITHNLKKRKSKYSSSPNCAQSKDMREEQQEEEMKPKKQRKDACHQENKKKAAKEAPTGYIHVRARRGQATDSHSLAERVPLVFS